MKITESDYRMFQIYAKEYKKVIEKNDIDRMFNLEDKMNNINEELTKYIKEFCRLDIEFKNNASSTPDPIKYFMDNGAILNTYDYINNTTWEGFWKKCSGKDLEYFISYLEYAIIYPNHDAYLENDKSLINIFKVETGFNKVPYGISCAEKINKKLLK